jgi:hypothetical protein
MNDWYYLTDDESVQGPISLQAMLELRACGIITDETRIAESGTDEWVRMGDASIAMRTIPPVPAVMGATDLSAKLLSNGKQASQKVLGHAGIFAKRILRSNFIDDKVSEPERQQLEQAGVQSPMAQIYLGWRRALLWFGAVFLALGLLAGAEESMEMLDDENPILIKLILIIAVATPIAACFFTFRAVLDWTKVNRTRSMVRLSWFFLFVVPILLALIPVSKLLGGEHFSSLGERQMFGIMWGTIMVLTIAPSLLGLFPAIIRSSLTIKTLIPESPMPGWVAAIVAPFYALFFLIFLVLSIQVGEMMLSLGMLCFALAPLVILMQSGRLVQPAEEAEAIRIVLAVRRKSLLSMLIGLGAVLFWFLQNLDSWNLEFLSVVTFVFRLLASFTILTVVTSDFLVGMFKIANDREALLRSGGMADALSNRFADLANLGLTELRAGEAELFQRIQGKGRKES